MRFNTAKTVEFLLARGSLPLLYWLKKDILDVPVDRESKNLRKYSMRVRILETQQPDGSWWDKRPDTPLHWERTLYRVDTLRNLYRLFDYGCSLRDDEIQKSVDFLFSLQTREGDFRGTVLNEYTPTFHALVLEILCRYGLDKDKRVQKGFRWALDNRQKDGGWGLYRRQPTNGNRGPAALPDSAPAQPYKPVRTQPFSHHVTGIILRALAESPTWRKAKETRQVGGLLLGCFFCDEVYGDKHFPSDWEHICYPLWNTDIVASLDALSKIGFSPADPTIQRGLSWIRGQQNPQGIWECVNGKATLDDHLWATLTVLRILKRFDLLEG